MWQLKHLSTWCMWYTVNCFIVYKNLLTKFYYMSTCRVYFRNWAASDNHPLLITVALLLFKFENKKVLHDEVAKSQGSALSGFNWQHSKSYIMPQSTDFFCHTMFFAKFNMLRSFSLHLQMLMEHIPLHNLPVEEGHSVAHRVWRDLFLKAFHYRWKASYWGGCFKWEINDQIISRVEEFNKYIFSNHFSFFQSWRDIWR